MLHHLSDSPSPELARKLGAFEEQFLYPLGPGRHFRISHGEDYSHFFQAMGEAAVFVVEREGQVAGTLAVVARRLTLPNGDEQPVAYFGDLKIVPAARGGVALMRLVRAVNDWIRPKVRAAFSVVMDGTPVTPDAYTGRLGIPAFRAVGKALVLRLIGAPGTVEVAAASRSCTPSEGMTCFRRLSTGRWFCADATPAKRSEIEPIWLMEQDGSACGLLEDTRRGKRLIADDGSELLSAHFSYFACASPTAGASLLRMALTLAGRHSFPALFVAVAEPDAGPLQAALGGIEVITATATVYGAELEAGGLWNINTAEI